MSEVSSGLRRLSRFACLRVDTRTRRRGRKRIHDKGAYCDASQVRVPCVCETGASQGFTSLQSLGHSLELNISKHSEVVVNKEGV